MKTITQQQLADWCGDFQNCYYYQFDGELYNTRDCIWVCEYMAEDVAASSVFEDVTNNADQYHKQLQYEVEHNGCHLFKILKFSNTEIIICYFDHNEEE